MSGGWHCPFGVDLSHGGNVVAVADIACKPAFVEPGELVTVKLDPEPGEV